MSDRFIFEHHLDRKIKYCLNGNVRPELQDAVLDVICGDKVVWEYQEWLDKLAELDACELTIREVMKLGGKLV
tara:strand:- start:4063 stop:4281 length:219 start_codon:yes stop_codon:yes gene_type:complete